MLHVSRSAITPLMLVGVGAITAIALAGAPEALAATPGRAAATPAATKPKSAPFTIGLSLSTVKPGQKLSVSGLANARAGLNLTILSKAIASSKLVNGLPAVQTPALVEGIYRTVVQVPAATKPGTYPVLLRFKNKQVASTKVRVVAASSQSLGSTRTSQCARIGFTVLHNDHVANANLPAGAYTIWSGTLDCATASTDFTSFLALGGKPVPGWTTTPQGTGQATFTQRSTGHRFAVRKNR